MTITATKAEVKALRWLIARDRFVKIDGSELWAMYADESDLRPRPMRVTAWKRNSQRTLNRMREKGLVQWNSLSFSRHGRFYFDITDAGREAAA